MERAMKQLQKPKGVLPGETDLLKGDLGISMDKNVAEFELPKVVTSCEGAGGYHEITDICVDKGVASDEKILSQTSRDSGLEKKILLPDNEVFRDESIAESTAASLNAEETNKCLEETTRDSNTNGVETTLPENCKVKWGSNQKMVTSEANKMPDNRQVESGTIAFNNAAFAPTPDYIENNQPLHNQDGSKVSESHTHVGRDQQSHGESSFPVLLGPIACSGSLSVRSDSSVSTSTRSFAFPVLQSEWNSSPVRMAKADRRLCQKHSGWWKGLLCCKF